MKKTAVTAVGAVKVADAKARRSILVWAGMHLPIRRSDADESPDPVELAGYSAVRHDIVAKPTGCMDCPERSDACGNCKFSGDGEDDSDSYEALAELTRLLAALMHLPRYPVLHTRNDSRQYLHLAAPAFRGSGRMTAELQSSRRMNS